MIMNDKNTGDHNSQQRIALAVQIKREEGLLKELEEEYYERFGKSKNERDGDRFLYGVFILIWIAAMIAIIRL